MRPAGFSRMVLPSISVGAAARIAWYAGTFHGSTASVTPVASSFV